MSEEFFKYLPLLSRIARSGVFFLCDFPVVDHGGFHLEEFGLHDDVVPGELADPTDVSQRYQSELFACSYLTSTSIASSGRFCIISHLGEYGLIKTIIAKIQAKMIWRPKGNRHDKVLWPVHPWGLEDVNKILIFLSWQQLTEHHDTDRTYPPHRYTGYLAHSESHRRSEIHTSRRKPAYPRMSGKTCRRQPAFLGFPMAQSRSYK
jgi:hypothetical protein